MSVYFVKGQASCNNEDFESSPTGTVTTINQIAGWTTDSGNNGGGSGYNCASTICCTGNPIAQILNSGYVDPIIGSGYPIYSVFGTTPNAGSTVPLNSAIGPMYGNSFIKLNDNSANYSVSRVSKTISVTSSNCLLKFATIILVGSGHACCDAGAMVIKVTNLTSSITISTYSYSGIAPACSPTSAITYYTPGSTATATIGSEYNPWHIDSLNLSPYIGNNIKLDIMVMDCTGGSHYTYGYVDAKCGPTPITTEISSLTNHYYFKLYPNPGNGNFNMDIAKDIAGEIEIRNIVGQLVFKQSVKQGSNSINTDNLSKGIYNYNIIQNKEILSAGKLVIE